MCPAMPDWDSDGEQPSQAQRKYGQAGFRGSREFHSVSETPCVKYAFCQKTMKDEDLLLVEKDFTPIQGGPTWSCFCVLDGHTGITAAQYVRKNLCQTLGSLLPKENMPQHDSEGFESFALDVRIAVVKGFMSLDQQFRADLPGSLSGTTVTMALLCGRLLTMANVGDSDAYLDTGTDQFMLTVNHRIDDNASERQRLSEAGVRVASLAPCLSRPAAPGEKSLGPLRCWPGGLAFSRSVGDIEAGGHVFACPHVFQLIVPESGARVLIGSDGLWDLITCQEGARTIRGTPVQNAASRLLTQALFQNDWCFNDDTTALVVDVLPSDACEFPKLVKEKQKREQLGKPNRKGQWGLGCLCIKSTNVADNELDMNSDRVRILASIDGWELLKQALEATPTDSCSSIMELTTAQFRGCGKENRNDMRINRASTEKRERRRPSRETRRSSRETRRSSRETRSSSDWNGGHELRSSVESRRSRELMLPNKERSSRECRRSRGSRCSSEARRSSGQLQQRYSFNCERPYGQGRYAPRTRMPSEHRHLVEGRSGRLRADPRRRSCSNTQLVHESRVPFTMQNTALEEFMDWLGPSEGIPHTREACDFGTVAPFWMHSPDHSTAKSQRHASRATVESASRATWDAPSSGEGDDLSLDGWSKADFQLHCPPVVDAQRMPNRF